MTLFRFSRGPFKSSRFGRTVAEARDHLLRLLKEDPKTDFVQLWLTGMAKDEAGWCNVGGPASSDFSGTHAVALLEKRKGHSSKTLISSMMHVQLSISPSSQVSCTCELTQRRTYDGSAFTILPSH